MVLAGKDMKPAYTKALGIANRQTMTPITLNTKFKIASLTKTFTAVVVLQLLEEGKIDLNAKIERYLPGYKGPGKSGVSIHNLLTYSSGIPNCEQGMGIRVYQEQMPIDTFINRYCSDNAEFTPGTKFSYNNGDYILLGRIIEAITGKTFEENLSERILKPLGMTNTGMLRNQDIIANLAETYNIDDSTGKFYRDAPMYIENYFAAGAMYATAEDLWKFDRALFGHRLLKKETVNIMLTPHPELYGVAYGFWVTKGKVNGKEIMIANRQGSIWGANADWTHVIDNNFSIILLSNTNATNLPELTAKILDASNKN